MISKSDLLELVNIRLSIVSRLAIENETSYDPCEEKADKLSNEWGYLLVLESEVRKSGDVVPAPIQERVKAIFGGV